MNYIPTIGLEIHAELNTNTKMFCDCLNNDKEIEPNKNVCPVCMGHPGALPKPNKQAIESVIKTGFALNCGINKHSKFDRKNYFYPDLPKAFQISQYDLPLCKKGKIELKSGKMVEITRIHLEEDTARLIHPNSNEKYTLVDFNRSGVPLMELVTEPCFSSAEDVVEFAKEFQLILKSVGVSDADMERGHLRLEANISISSKEDKDKGNLGTKVEVKNLNSFNSIFGAIQYEIKRQEKALEKKEEIIQETRGWDEDKQKTISQRTKESAHDYRYFPEPDIPPIKLTDEYLNNVKSRVGELPSEKRNRLSTEYNLSENETELFIENIDYSNFFEKSVSELGSLIDAPDINLIYNYLTSDIRGIEKEFGICLDDSKITPHMLAHAVYLIQENKISSRAAKDSIKEAFLNGIDPEKFITENNLFSVSDEGELEKIIQEVIDENNKVWHDYEEGKDSAVQFLIGQVMSKTKGKADPSIVIKIFKDLKEGK